MIKRWAKLFLIITISISSLSGCDKKEYTKEEVYGKFQDTLTKIESYECVANITAKGNKSTQEYEVKHKYESPEYYNLEIISPSHLKGKVMEYKDDKVTIKNPNINDEVELDNPGKNNQYLFIGDFIKNYMNTENVEVDMANNMLSLEIVIPGGNDYFNRQILYINVDEMNPEKMEILDDKGIARFTVEYDNFEYDK